MDIDPKDIAAAIKKADPDTLLQIIDVMRPLMPGIPAQDAQAMAKTLQTQVRKASNAAILALNPFITAANKGDLSVKPPTPLELAQAFAGAFGLKVVAA